MSTPYNGNFYDKDGLPINKPTSDQPMGTPGMSQYGQYGQQPYNAMPQYMPPAGYAQAYAPPKNRVLAAVLAFFLGTLGLHNFYLGYKNKAITQLVLTILSWVTLIFLVGFVIAAVVGIWAFVEFLMICFSAGPYATDANGMPMQ